MVENWFETWFDSPYYPLLYQNRNEQEAAFFLQNLLQHLALSPDAHIADIPCGRGRHAQFLSSLGYHVTGLDLSENSIEEARLMENSRLHFARHDMRKPFGKQLFDVILNLFTSFGYFDSEDENIHVINAFNYSLKPGGTLVIDFLNAEKVLKELVPYEEKDVSGIHFCIRKKAMEGCITKSIKVEDHDRTRQFYEKVQLVNRKDFERLLTLNGFDITGLFGNYALDSFDPEKSERLIIKARKRT